MKEIEIKIIGKQSVIVHKHLKELSERERKEKGLASCVG